jgi:hypothetical protein
VVYRPWSEAVPVPDEIKTEGMSSTRNGLNFKIMPNCIQYRRKGEKDAITLAKLDDEVCEYLGVTPDPNKFYLGWFDYIGLFHAMGKSNDWIRESIEELGPDSKYRIAYGKILDYLEENFTTNAWVEVGRR